MNFQAVEQANGNKITIFGTFTEVGGVEYTSQQKAKAICKIRDTTGVEHKVHIYQGTGQLPTTENLNRRYQFTLSTFQGNYQGLPYTGYSGFWNNNAQVNQNVPQNSSRPPQTVPQSTKPKSNGKDTSVERRGAFNSACSRAQGTDMTPTDIIDLAIQGQHFIETGDNINNKPKFPDMNEQSPTDSDVPF